MLVDFSTKSINEFYSLESVNSDAYDILQETPNYLEVLLGCLLMAKEDGSLIMKSTQCTSRSLQNGVTSSHHVSSRQLMCVK